MPASAKAPTPTFDVSAFARAYAIMGAQRATKILGIFARLDRRDGKPHYLKHLPRIEAYLIRNLAHPALAEAQGLVARIICRGSSRTMDESSFQIEPLPLSQTLSSSTPQTAIILAAGLGTACCRSRPPCRNPS